MIEGKQVLIGDGDYLFETIFGEEGIVRGVLHPYQEGKAIEHNRTIVEKTFLGSEVPERALAIGISAQGLETIIVPNAFEKSKENQNQSA